MGVRNLLGISLLAVLLAWSPALLAQPLPESVSVGDGQMTIGFELKTTVNGNGPEGRNPTHTLMDYIRPIEDTSWSESERAKVSRWSELSLRQKTAFFYETYRGGYYADNFQADVERYPFLEKKVSWDKSLGIPHLEVRSKPTDNPREAFELMKRLKAEIPETISFHTHLRFPHTADPAKAQALTDWVRRVSWAVWLRRADYSSRTDFVLKQADNQPVNARELDRVGASFNGSHTGEILERRGIRLQRLSNSDGTTSLDLELRGLVKDLSAHKRFMGLTVKAFSSGEFGPWAWNADSPLLSRQTLNVSLSRGSGWGGSQLDHLADLVEEGMGRHGVSSQLEGENLRAAVKRLATADNDAGKRTLLPSSFDWLFLPIEHDPALPEGVQEQVAKKKGEDLRKLVRLAERVHQGEFGTGQGYEPLKTATRARRILHDFLNESYSDTGKRGKLFEWYETSLFDPADVEERTKRWRRETGKNRAAELAASLLESRINRGFARSRPAIDDKNDPSPRTHWNRGEALAEMESIRRGALEHLQERLAAARTPAERALYRRGLERVRNAGFELSPNSAIRAEVVEGTSPEAKGKVVRVSSGLLNEIDRRASRAPGSAPERSALRARMLGLVVAHDLAHLGGTKAERAADNVAIEILAKARGPVSPDVIREAVAAFDRPLGSSRIDNFINRLRSLARYGTTRGRVANLERAARGESDPLARFRRPDGTLKWAQLTGDRATREALGLGNFALALFLKELAVVAKTGDRVRVEEFFEGLKSIDFYKQYGLFVLGARVGEVAYARFLERYVRPRFVSSILKTNLVLAAGLALPRIVEGTFSGKAFVISLGSLGLSTAAVRTGVAAVKWVYELKKAKNATSLAHLGVRAGKLARIGGWFYTAAELAVILYFADEIEQAVHGWLDRRAARKALADAGEAFFAALGAPGASEASIREASERYHATWIDYRNFLYAPLQRDEALYAARMEKVARKAKLLADRRRGTVERLERHASIRARILARHGSLQAYADHLAREDEEEVARDVAKYSDSFTRARDTHLREVYEADRRGTPYLGEATGLLWLAGGGRSGAIGDPWGRRSDLLANLARWSLKRSWRAALEDTSPNRLEAYDDELAALDAGLAALGARGRGDLAVPLWETRRLVERTRTMDEGLFRDPDGRFISTLRTDGATGALDDVNGAD